MTSDGHEWPLNATVALLQVAMTIELRRQCALKLQAIELRAEEASQAMTAYEGGDASSSAAEAAAEMASRQAEAEALRLKVAHYSSELVSLQTKLVHQESSETAVAKLEAVPDLKQAKAMLKAAFPQVIATDGLSSRSWRYRSLPMMV